MAHDDTGERDRNKGQGSYREKWKSTLREDHLKIEGFKEVGGYFDLCKEGKVKTLVKEYSGKKHCFLVDEDGNYVHDVKF